jgi:hypothetical protein
VRCRINQGAARARRPAVVGRGLSEGLGLSARMEVAGLSQLTVDSFEV